MDGALTFHFFFFFSFPPNPILFILVVSGNDQHGVTGYTSCPCCTFWVLMGFVFHESSRWFSVYLICQVFQVLEKPLVLQCYVALFAWRRCVYEVHVCFVRRVVVEVVGGETKRRQGGRGIHVCCLLGSIEFSRVCMLLLVLRIDCGCMSSFPFAPRVFCPTP